MLINHGKRTFFYDSSLFCVALGYVPLQTTLHIQCSTIDPSLVSLLPVLWLSGERGALVNEDRHESDPGPYAALMVRVRSHQFKVSKTYLVLRFVLPRRIDPIMSLALISRKISNYLFISYRRQKHDS